MQRQQKEHMKSARKLRLYGPVATVFDANNTGSWRLSRPVVDFSKCVKCGICETFCPGDVITVFEDRAECVAIDYDYCKGCGICANECPKGCIRMVPEGGVV